jgi:hypothetical protein
MLARKGFWLVGLAVAVGSGGGAARAQQAPSQQADTQQTPSMQSETKTCKESAIKVEFPFNSDSAGIDASRVAEVSAWLAGGPGRTVVVKASTDKSGDPAYNEALSVRRAQAVEQALINQGVDPIRVTVIGEGESAAVGESAPQMRTAVVLLCEGPEPSPPAAAVAPPAAAPPEEPAPAPVEEVAPEEVPPPEGPIAQEVPPPVVEPVPYETPVAQTAMEDQETGVERIGVGFMLGGGVVDFTDEEARALTDLGGSWDIRAVIGSKMPVALELAYVGQAQGLDVTGLDNDSILLGNGGEGVLRLQLPQYVVRPYVLGGVGWLHYSLSNTGNTVSAMAESDDVLTVPLGLGFTLAAAWGGTLDVRGTFKLAYYEDLMSDIYSGTGLEANLHTWGVQATFGWEF